MSLKPLLYDWNGLNTEIFYAINGFQPGEAFTQFMIFGSKLGKYTIFPAYYLLAVLIGYWLVQRKKASDPAGYPAYKNVWVDTLIVLLLAYFFSFAWVPVLKDYFHFMRPFVALPPDSVQITEAMRTSENPMASFPSGHSSFAMLMVAGLWPVLSRAFKGLAVAYLIWAGWSRIALGVHFPADVLYAFIISCIAVLCVRNAWMSVRYRKKPASG